MCFRTIKRVYEATNKSGSIPSEGYRVLSRSTSLVKKVVEKSFEVFFIQLNKSVKGFTKTLKLVAPLRVFQHGTLRGS